jgi:hypothetical protein
MRALGVLGAGVMAFSLLFPVMTIAASQPLIPTKCPDPSKADPQGPQSIIITQELPEGQAEQFLKTAIYCPSACYDLVAQLTLKKTGLTSGGLDVTITPHNNCSGTQNQNRGCAKGMTEPRMQIITEDSIGQISVFGMGKKWLMPAQNITKSRCDDQVIYRAFNDFLGGLAQAQNNPDAAVSQMQQALSNLQSQTDPRPIALAGGDQTAKPGAALGLPGPSPTETLAQGDTGKQPPNPIKQTVQPNLASKSSAPDFQIPDNQNPAVEKNGGNIGDNDWEKIAEVQSHPQTGATLDTQKQGSQVPPPAGLPTGGSQAPPSGPTSQLTQTPSNGYNQLAPSVSNNSGSNSNGGLFGGSGGGILSMLGNLLKPLMSLFTGSKSSTPPPPPPPATVTLTAQPPIVLRGASISLTWSSNGTSPIVPCTVSQDGREIGQGPAGALTIATSTTSPNLLVFGVNCQGASGGQVQRSASVTVQ